jgi:Rieske Fe-S protein
MKKQEKVMSSQAFDQRLPVLDRREFLRKTVKAAGAVAVGSYTIVFLNSCSDSDSPTGPSNGGGDVKVTVDLSQAENASLNAVGGTLALGSNQLDNSGLLLYRLDEQTVRAYSRNCPHQGCTTGSFSNGVSTCPCHGSQFNLSGAVIQGPAASGLRQYSTSIEGDVVTIE